MTTCTGAWKWAVEHQQHERLAQAIHSIGLFYQWRNRYQEGEALYHLAVHHIESLSLPSTIAQRVLAHALAWQSVFLRVTGQVSEAGRLLQQSLASLGAITTPDKAVQQVMAFVWLQLGRLGEAQTDFVACKQSYQQAWVNRMFG